MMSGNGWARRSDSFGGCFLLLRLLENEMCG